MPTSGDYAIRIKLISRSNTEGVWVGFPDTGEYMDTAHPDELLLGLDALNAETWSNALRWMWSVPCLNLPICLLSTIPAVSW